MGKGSSHFCQNDIIQLKTFPNPKTGFGYAKPTQLKKIRLDDDAAYLNELAAMQEGEKESHVNNDNSSVMNDDILSNNREPSSKNIATQKRIALVIGNSAYVNRGTLLTYKLYEDFKEKTVLFIAI